MIRAAVLGLALAAGALPALAHQLRVFASVEDDTVVVETTFSNGRAPASAELRVFDADDALVATLPAGPDGVTRFPLDPAAAAGGLRIEVEAGDGHSDYWLLTPDDIARGAGGGS